MKIDVYDSYANSNGRLMHFDIFVKSGTSELTALEYGRNWLGNLGENTNALEQSRCNFCHSETANPDVAMTIENKGYFVLQMEGCPAPY